MQIIDTNVTIVHNTYVLFTFDRNTKLDLLQKSLFKASLWFLKFKFVIPLYHGAAICKCLLFIFRVIFPSYLAEYECNIQSTIQTKQNTNRTLSTGLVWGNNLSDIQLQKLHSILQNSTKQCHPPSFRHKCIKYWPIFQIISPYTQQQIPNISQMHCYTTLRNINVGFWILIFTIGTCESVVCVRIESRIESAMTLWRNTNWTRRSVINN